MDQFKVGDRVSVRATSLKKFHAGRAGEVAWVSRAPDGTPYAYHVRLDGSAGEAQVVFAPHELEPEARP